MRLIKKTHVYLIILGVLFFAAGTAQAGGVIEEWVARYNGPGGGEDMAQAIAVDGSGNIYVTGSGSCGYTTIKYDTNGNQKWVGCYNEPENYYSRATAIVLDGSGNVYVTGYSLRPPLEPSPEPPEPTWMEDYAEYATIKYDSDGNEIWVRTYKHDESGGEDYATAIAVDGSSNIFVTGVSCDFGVRGYATIKYDSDGNELWARRYGAELPDGGAFAYAIAVDGAGNVYVTGESWGGDTDWWDYATIKYDPNGNEQWVCRYNGPGNSSDSAFAIAIDGSGNVYVTGESGGDYATIKYDSDGNELWVVKYNGPGNYADYAYAIAVDGSGNIYVTGGSYSSGIDPYEDYATIKYDSDGNELWARRYDGPGNSYDYARAIALDVSGNIYATGYSIGSGPGYDYATIKYASAGNEIWVRRYNGPGNYADYSNAIAVDGSGNVYVTGMSYGSGTSSDYATIKYAQCLSPFAGDLNDDCKVNFIDLAIIAENWLKCNWSNPEICW